MMYYFSDEFIAEAKDYYDFIILENTKLLGYSLLNGFVAYGSLYLLGTFLSTY